MNKRIIGALLVALAFFGGRALAAQNVANTSQQGSLLIWPLISVDPEDSTDTFVEISNDGIGTVHVECEYINEQKGRVNFDFFLTAKQTLSWEALTGSGGTDINGGTPIATPAFPYGGDYPSLSPTIGPLDDRIGELVCFAVDTGRANQVVWNHLTGNATVANFYDGDAYVPTQAFRYNAWAFAARGNSGPSTADGTVIPGPGKLLLTGGGWGTYDACPLYNTANFMPNGSYLGPQYNVLYTLDNDLAVSICNQDLRQDFNLHITKLQFTTWNELENSFTGAYVCADSTDDEGLSYSDNSYLVDSGNFDFGTLGTPNARFQVQGVASTQCFVTIPNPANPSTNIIINSENTGLLGVLTSSIGLNYSSEDQEIGSTTQGAGTEAGYVLWDPNAGGPPPVRPKH